MRFAPTFSPLPCGRGERLRIEREGPAIAREAFVVRSSQELQVDHLAGGGFGARSGVSIFPTTWRFSRVRWQMEQEVSVKE